MKEVADELYQVPETSTEIFILSEENEEVKKKHTLRHPMFKNAGSDYCARFCSETDLLARAIMTAGNHDRPLSQYVSPDVTDLIYRKSIRTTTARGGREVRGRRRTARPEARRRLLARGARLRPPDAAAARRRPPAARVGRKLWRNRKEEKNAANRRGPSTRVKT
ncbi:hypothetical protein EVAR_46002_1 [Eumeta japonica]|uniref:Uncharacterized protein n=1 Tax=Eumeta variegata TaxID=151549 RepID=A0A4C1XB55_EUMVA|nr:hypothetical protein EVAR_46002_1 [Eumeta japonica]